VLSLRALAESRSHKNHPPIALRRAVADSNGRAHRMIRIRAAATPIVTVTKHTNSTLTSQRHLGRCAKQITKDNPTPRTAFSRLAHRSHCSFTHVRSSSSAAPKTKTTKLEKKATRHHEAQCARCQCVAWCSSLSLSLSLSLSFVCSLSPSRFSPTTEERDARLAQQPSASSPKKTVHPTDHQRCVSKYVVV